MDLVYTIDNNIISSIMFSKAKIISDTTELDTLVIASFCIERECQNKRYGRKLIAEDLNRAKELGYKVALYYGYSYILYI